MNVPLYALFLLCAATGFEAEKTEVNDYFDDGHIKKDSPVEGSLEEDFVDDAYPSDYELMRDPHKKRICSKHMCKKLCQHGFEKDEDGCPTCKCVQKSPRESSKTPKTTAATRSPTKCPKVKCRRVCYFGFEKDEDGCKICKCKRRVRHAKLRYGRRSYTKISIFVRTTNSRYNGPHFSLTLTMNPRLRRRRFVTESCYVSSTKNSRRFYIIRKRFPTLHSRVRYTPRRFNIGFSASRAQRLRQLLRSAKKPHIKCRLRICPLLSNRCNFGYRYRIQQKKLLHRISKEKSFKPLRKDEDEIVDVDAAL